MADINKKYVDYAGLSKYDELIKGKIAADIATEETRATGVEGGLQSAIDTLNGDDTTTGSVAKAVKDGVDALDAQLAAVAKSGDAGDLAYDNSDSGLAATDVKAAIAEVGPVFAELKPETAMSAGTFVPQITVQIGSLVLAANSEPPDELLMRAVRVLKYAE